MIKLYKRTSVDGLRYHEAWTADRVVIEHWGVVGSRGEARSHALAPSEAEAAGLERVLAPVRADGFAEVELDDHRTLIIEYTVVGRGTRADLRKRHALESRMNETLGWTGLGHCDGGSIGSGTMEVCCLVVDFAVAKSVIAHDLAGTEFADYVRIYDEDEE